jgi:hypothetical protein
MNETFFNFSYVTFGLLLTTGGCYGLFRGSRTFLLDPGKGNFASVRCVTRLLVVAFALLMTGYTLSTSWFLAGGPDLDYMCRRMVLRIGLLLLVTGLTLLLALFVLGSLRNRTRREGNQRESILA